MSTASHVLLVDDDALIRKVIRRQFLALGLRVTEAGGVEDALLHIDRGEVFDLLFTDWSMPGPSVDDLIDRVRKSTPDCRIIVSSGLSTEELHSRDPESYAVLPKPFSIEDLRAIVERILGSPS